MCKVKQEGLPSIVSGHREFVNTPNNGYVNIYTYYKERYGIEFDTPIRYFKIVDERKYMMFVLKHGPLN